MTAAAVRAKAGLATRLVQALALGTVFLTVFVATRLVPELEGGLATVSAVGFLLLAGTLASELLETKEIQVYGSPNDGVLEMITQLSQTGVPIIVKPNHLAGFTRLGS